VAAKKLPFFPRLSAAVLRYTVLGIARVSREGFENIPQSGPVLFICNHCSNADGLLFIAYFIPAMDRKMVWLGKEEATRWPFLGWAMKGNGVVGIRRGAGDLEAFKLAKSVLDGGLPLTIFPEGTRSPNGALQAAKEGATVLAIRSGAPVYPVAIIGSHKFWGRGHFLPRPGRRMTMRVGKPFTLTMPQGGDRHESLRLATVEMMKHVAELLPPEQRGVYGDEEATRIEGTTDGISSTHR
jgi:1-acyl-sn-glycerol-3-phosphate acyltransferase